MSILCLVARAGAAADPQARKFIGFQSDYQA
jgi:hypothetical protein